MDDYSLPLSLTSHLLIAPLGVYCKFAVLNNNNKKILYDRGKNAKPSTPVGIYIYMKTHARARTRPVILFRRRII